MTQVKILEIHPEDHFYRDADLIGLTGQFAMEESTVQNEPPGRWFAGTFHPDKSLGFEVYFYAVRVEVIA